MPRDTARTLAIALGVLAGSILMVGCRGDGPGRLQDQVALMVVTELERDIGADDGVEIDTECVRAVTARLGDDDARSILAADPIGTADVSDEAAALTGELFDCIGFLDESP